MSKYTKVVGVDEAGRGPLAGPVAVGAVVVPKNFDWRLVEGVRDSKKLSHKNREAIFMRTKQLQREGRLDFKISMVSAKVIDRVGITRAVAMATARALKRLQLNPNTTFIKLDGLLKAPEIFVNQETIVGGDDSEPEIALASIIAKVTRDRHMTRITKKYPHYGFEIHKGYGTKSHRSLIKEHGMCEIHRKSFCRNLRGVN